jgi:signal transduction histidine kinase
VTSGTARTPVTFGTGGGSAALVQAAHSKMTGMRTSRLVHRWLRVAGTITWTVIGATFLMFFLDVPAVLDGGRSTLWALAFAGFLLLFWLHTGPDVEQQPRSWRIASLLLQSLCALAIAGLPSKPVGFIFLTLVAAQMAGLVAPFVAAGWVVLQTAAMGWIYAQIVPLWEAQAYIAVYLGFQAFAHMVVRAALNEVRARDDLARAHDELRRKDVLLAESQRLAERARISQDLHDVLGHHLTAMSLNLEVASHLTSGEAHTHVDRAQGLARRLLDDVREVVTELRHQVGYDLHAALSRLAAGLLRPTVHLEVAPEVRHVADAERAEALLRCAQELMTNAARHSGGEHLWLTVRRRGAGIELGARDDGLGAERVAPGLGLTGLEERLQRLGGGLSVVTAPRQGFQVTAWLP